MSAKTESETRIYCPWCVELVAVEQALRCERSSCYVRAQAESNRALAELNAQDADSEDEG